MANSIICKNCNHRFKGNFCNNCGQAAHSHRLGLHYIWHDLQHGVFHFDNGIFYTIKQLLTKPGHTIREFIEGKRVRHFKPLALIVILAAIYGLIYHYFIIIPFANEPINAGENILSVYQKILRWSIEHFAYATFILIISTTIASYSIFKKQGFNLAEHLVLNTFYRGLTLIFGLVLLPLQYIIYCNSGTEGLKYYALISQLLDFGLMYWCYAQFFNKLTKTRTLGLTVLTYLWMVTINMLFGYVAGWIVFYV
ncbi:MAG: hypothetical protein JWN56_1322 [Sphingobacteriales bacterium]|nr:hypothetical protein [Sphingobacteriales bacterium]